MAKKTIYLSGKSFRDAADWVRQYRDSLDAKVKQFCEELAEIGADVISADLATHDMGTGGTLDSLDIVYDGENGVYKATIRVTSDAILFIEFGSGLHGYGAPHIDHFPYGPGTYPPGPRQDPDYDNWENPNGWLYYGDDGKLHWSDGMTPTYPMYKGSKEMEAKVVEVAKRVFGNA